MADITWTVELLFRTTGRFYDFFILDESTLDGPSVLGSDETWVDISDDVDSISVKRGRSRDLDGFRAGTCAVTLDDPDRTYDPTNEDSPFWGNILPAQPIRVTATLGGVDYPIFYGYVQGWPTDYGTGFLPAVTIDAADGLSVLANQDLDEIASAHAGETSGTRVSRVLDLDEVDWDAALRDIAAGQTTLGATTFGEGALKYLQTVAQSEYGALFVAGDGDLTFRERWGTASDVQATFSDDEAAAAVVYEAGLAQDFSLDLVHNRVSVAGATGNVQTEEDVLSQDAYQVRSLDRTNLFMEDDTDAADQAKFLLARFRDPELRFAELNVLVDVHPDARKAELLDLELADRIQVEFTPPGAGTPNQIVRAAVVDGLSWTVGAAGETRLTVAMTAGPKTFPFTLDDPQLGVLNGDAVLAY